MGANQQICSALAAAAGYDADAQEFFDRADAAGTLSAGTKTLYNNLVLTAKADSWWANVLRMNMVAGDWNVSKVPLNKTLGFTLDSAVNLGSGDYSESTGWKGNGTDKRVDTGVVLNTLTLGDVAMMYAGSSMETTAVDKVAMGARQASPYRGVLLTLSEVTTAVRRFTCGSSGPGYLTPSLTASVLLGNQVSTTDTKLYENGTQVATVATAAGAALTDVQTINILCVMFNATPLYFTAGYCRGYGIFTGLTTGKITSIKNAVEAFNDGLGRGVI